jgi:hypothetical protein
MNPTEFMKRVIERARSRYGLRLTQAVVEDWVHEGFLEPARPTGLARAGRPPWTRNWHDYRRALEICRMKSRLTPGRRFHNDEIRIQLWLSGRDFEGIDIPALVCHEFRRAVAKLRAPFRSVFDPRGAIGIGTNQIDKRAAKMGAPMPDIVPPGFKYESAELVGILALQQFGDFKNLDFAGSKRAPVDFVRSILD